MSGGDEITISQLSQLANESIPYGAEVVLPDGTRLRTRTREEAQAAERSVRNLGYTTARSLINNNDDDDGFPF